MPIFTYRARDSFGKQRVGTVDARSEASAVGLLKEQGLYVISLEERKTNLVEQLSNIRGVSTTETVAFTRQLSTMVSAGLPISRALEVLSEQSTNPKFRKILLDALRDVEGGTSLSSAFGRFPRIFSPTYIALVRAGESSGKLDEVLLRLADTMEADRELSAQFTGALIYPAIIFVAMIGVFILMMVFVVPKLADMYYSLNVELPAITQFMISMSDFIVHKYYIVILIVVGIGFATKTFLATPIGSDMVSVAMFKMPVFGKINKQKEIAQYTRTLSLLVSAAIPIVEALNIVADVVKNKLLKEAAYASAQNVEKGNSLSDYVKSNKNFPPIVGQMISVGEETGQLDSVLDRVADFFDGETSHAVKGLAAALEPIILIMLGGMVGVLIISIITPIYKITSAL